ATFCRADVRQLSLTKLTQRWWFFVVSANVPIFCCKRISVGVLCVTTRAPTGASFV
ncbi:unnamed protein product, partial [Tenebrio molitor]